MFSTIPRCLALPSLFLEGKQPVSEGTKPWMLAAAVPAIREPFPAETQRLYLITLQGDLIFFFY